MSDKEKLIAKLYKGTCSREELELLMNLIHEDQHGDYTEIMQHLWQELKSYREIEEPRATEMVQRTLAKIEEKESSQASKGGDNKNERRIDMRRRRLLTFASAAAAVLLLISTLSLLWLRSGQIHTVQTAFAQQKTIELPDQSTVKLNANSSIRFHKNWNSTEVRQVWLEGEAYFEVRKNKDTDQKFQVITQDLTVDVLGTVFNVNTRKVATKVFLKEGKVSLALDNQSEEILMEPGELVTYSKSSGKPLKKRIEKEAPSSWKDGTAILEDALLKDIIQKIHEIYDVTILVENEIQLEREFSINLPVDNPEIGFTLLEGLGLKIEKADKQWTIK